MTLTKLALAVLGTIGLTAGTVLAVAEPAPKPLPIAVAQAARTTCPGSACSKSGCPNSACAVATATKVETQCTACPVAARQTEPIAAELVTEHDTIAGPLPAGYNDEASACACPGNCPSARTACEAAAHGAAFVGLGINSNAVAKGRIVLTPGAGCEHCAASSCSGTACSGNACTAGACQATACEEGECSVAGKKPTRCVTFGIGISTGGPVFHFSDAPVAESECQTCPKVVEACSAATFAKRLASSLFGGTAGSTCDETGCEISQSITATACQATPVSADHAFPICAAAGCAETKCCEEACHEDAAVSASCDTCGRCTCASCECDSSEVVAESTAPSAHRDSTTKEHTFLIGGERVTVRTHVRHGTGDGSFDVLSDPAPTNSPIGAVPPLALPRWRPLPNGWATDLTREDLERLGIEDCDRPGIEGFSSDIADGVPSVIRSGVSNIIVRNDDSYRLETSADAPEAPGRVRVTHVSPIEFHPRADMQFFTSHPELGQGQRIRLSGFAAPVAAPLPPRILPSRFEGTWTRATRAGTTEFTHTNGRIHGSWQIRDGVEVRFSGSCSVVKDDQFVGVIDEIDTCGDASEAFQPAQIALQRLVDQPFAARVVVDGDSLIIKDFRCSGLSPNLKDEKQTSELLECVRAFACGRFEHSKE